MKKQTRKSLALAALAVPFAMSSSALAETSGTTTVNIEVDETLSLVLSTDNINFATAGSGLMTNNMVVTGATNSAAGYAVSVNVNNNYTELKHQSSGVSAYIPTLSSAVTAESFPDIAWGYANSIASASDEVSNDTTFNPISTTSTKIFNTSINGSASHVFTVGAKINNTLPAGTYSNDLLFTITANPVPRNSIEDEMIDRDITPVNDPISGKSYFPMQAMTPEICQAATLEEQVQLIDTRDHKLYWVAKLADGHCWMTQNLDLNLDSMKALTSKDTDLNVISDENGAYSTSNGYSRENGVISWLPAESTKNFVTSGDEQGPYNVDWPSDNDNTPTSADTGEWYWKGKLNHDNSRECNYIAKLYCTHTDFFSETPIAATYYEHGHVGNHYNFAAAVASNDTSGYKYTERTPANNPQNSICPKGWRLPTSYPYDSDYTEAGSKDEYTRLAYLYGNYSGNGYSSMDSEALESAPFYSVRNGYFQGGNFNYPQYQAYYRTSTVGSDDYAYSLKQGVGSGNPISYDLRQYGMGIRCVAK